MDAWTQAILGFTGAHLTGEAGAWGLFLSAFVSSTLLPGGSEVLLLAQCAAAPEKWGLWVGVATLGNTLGSLTTYAIGRLLPRPAGDKLTPGQVRAYAWANRAGAWVLLFSWVPIVGDLLPAAAAWAGVGLTKATVAIALGKAARYLALALLGAGLAAG